MYEKFVQSRYWGLEVVTTFRFESKSQRKDKQVMLCLEKEFRITQKDASSRATE